MPHAIYMDVHVPLSSEWQRLGRPFLGILYGPQGASLGRLIENIELIAMCAEVEELSGRVTYLPS
jgi:hypothetical protein